MQKLFIFLLFVFTVQADFLQGQDTFNSQIQMENSHDQTATFGTGCFWCSEAIFSRLKGVEGVTPGYCGGATKNPTYKEVCTGETGHAEVIQLVFDPEVISYKELLEVFWKTHDPTTLNRQGADEGTQYRSVIFYHNPEQELQAKAYLEALTQAGIWEDPIITEIAPFTVFYSAEAYHDDYYANNPGNGYCNIVITPKIEKFEKVFADKLK
jgi:peptide-methionine (S)-S-oxide reductase